MKPRLVEARKGYEDYVYQPPGAVLTSVVNTAVPHKWPFVRDYGSYVSPSFTIKAPRAGWNVIEGEPGE